VERWSTVILALVASPNSIISVSLSIADLIRISLDPLFYLHHANLDRIWWNWEQNDLQTRLTDISGRSTVDPPFTNVTLAFQLKMSNLANLVTIGDVMDIRTPLLCYNYV